MPIRVVPYDPSWPEQFTLIRAALAAALRDVPIVAIEHVGGLTDQEREEIALANRA